MKNMKNKIQYMGELNQIQSFRLTLILPLCAIADTDTGQGLRHEHWHWIGNGHGRWTGTAPDMNSIMDTYTATDMETDTNSAKDNVHGHHNGQWHS